jgi:leucyl-tRNA synthetase
MANHNKKYDHKKVEKKWQKEWAKKKVHKTEDSSKKPKFYILDMFPYPSGEGLHVGHPKGYIATDIVSRMKRMQGHNVLHPMGFDAFGLPAENYAIKTKTNPMVSVAKNVERYKKQLEILGFDYDWSREINTTDPKYYKWTQWIFAKIFEKGLAYESFEPINWCPSCKTGLANEDVEDGKCERCGTVVEKKPMRQWVLRITDYADRLLADLDAVTGIPLVEKKAGEDAFRPNEPVSERNAIVSIIKHWSEDKFLCSHWKATGWQGFLIGGKEEGETIANTVSREIREEAGFKNAKFIREIGKVDAKFYQMVKKKNRLAHFIGAYVELENGDREDTSQEEKDLQDFVWLSRDEVRKFLTHPDMIYLWDLFTGAKKQKIEPLLDWPESIKEAQRNWIGRSEGMLFTSPVKDTDLKIQTFSAHFEAFAADTFVVIAPDHPLLPELVKGTKEEKKVLQFAQVLVNERNSQGYDANKEPKGIFTGRYTIDPVGNGELPIWVASYALADYGTGIVKCSCHDERDFAFAKKYNIKLKPVLFPPDPEQRKKVESLEICYSDMKQGILSEPKGFNGRKAGECRGEVIKYLEKNDLAKKKVTYRLKDWVFSRQRYWGEKDTGANLSLCFMN